jgi:phosphatidylinositol alpha-1,6-mannosyltransferase
MRQLDISRNWRTATNIVVSQDFFPKIGGAHTWLYESYRRWSTPVRLLTQTYSQDARISQAELEFDRGRHGSLQILREIVPPEKVDLLNTSCWKSYAGQLRSIRRLAGSEPVILHCLRAFPDGFAGALYKMLHPRATVLVIYAHGEEVLIAKTSGQLGLMAWCAYATADLIIANSQSTRRLVDHLCSNDKTVCVHPGVDPANFQLPAEEVAGYRASWGWPCGTVVLSTIARMEPRKNHRMGVEVLQKLRAEGIPLTFVCAGDGEERVRLEEMARAACLQEWIRFPGAVSEQQKRLLFAASDIYAMPSIQVGEMIEGFGMVFLEAAAAGVPAICGNTGGQPEAVLDGKTGIVVDGCDLMSVAAAVRQLAGHPEVRRYMGEQGRLWAADHAWEHVVERTRAAIDSVLDDALRCRDAVNLR